jgi:hypothetical protein
MDCTDPYGTFDRFLRHTLTPHETATTREHLDACPMCWDAWNRYRWDRAVGTSLYRDLTGFLGDRVIPYFDSSPALATEWRQADRSTEHGIREFYRNSVSYLYNLAIWEASGNRPAYVQAAAPLLAHLRSRVLIDYGSGIGSDTLALRELGFTVIPCDYRSPSTEFFQWRARRLGQPVAVYEPHELTTATQGDILWIIDTLDHLADIDDSLGHLLHQTDILVCERLSMGRAHGSQGFHYRRGTDEIEAIFHRYGLTPILSNTTASPVAIWRKHDRQGMAGTRDDAR